jgi:ABC-type Mn2+/Zn2+ transport system permease subunit
MLAFPALDQSWVPYTSVVVFCLATALALGALSRSPRVQPDAAIGIFLVASVAWGFLAREIFFNRRNAEPVFFDAVLFGKLEPFSSGYLIISLAICAAVVLVILGLWKEIIAYAFDPLLAETSGVRAGFIHYLLMLLVALVIVIGVRIAGSILVTALLILPGATALLLTRRLEYVLVLAIASALSGSVGGVLLTRANHSIPAGPAIVLIMFVEFLLAYAASRFPRVAAT